MEYGDIGRVACDELDYVGTISTAEDTQLREAITNAIKRSSFEPKMEYLVHRVVYEGEPMYAKEEKSWSAHWAKILFVSSYEDRTPFKVARIYSTLQREEVPFHLGHQKRSFLESWSVGRVFQAKMSVDETPRTRLGSARKEFGIFESPYAFEKQLVAQRIFRYVLDETSLKGPSKRGLMVPAIPVTPPPRPKEPLVSMVVLETEPLRDYFETDGLQAIESLEDTLYLPLVKALEGSVLSLQSIEEQFNQLIAQFEENVRNPAAAYVMSRLKGVAKFVAVLGDAEKAPLAYDREVDHMIRADLSDGDVSRKITARLSGNKKALEQFYAHRERIKLVLLRQFLSALKSEDYESQLRLFRAFQTFAYVIRVYVNDIEGRKLRDICDEMEASLLSSKRSREKENHYFA